VRPAPLSPLFSELGRTQAGKGTAKPAPRKRARVDGTNEGEVRSSEVEATRYARQRTGRRLEHYLAPAHNESTQKERVAKRIRAKRTSVEHWEEGGMDMGQGQP